MAVVAVAARVLAMVAMKVLAEGRVTVAPPEVAVVVLAATALISQIRQQIPAAAFQIYFVAGQVFFQDRRHLVAMPHAMRN